MDLGKGDLEVEPLGDAVPLVAVLAEVSPAQLLAPDPLRAAEPEMGVRHKLVRQAGTVPGLVDVGFRAGFRILVRLRRRRAG